MTRPSHPSPPTTGETVADTTFPHVRTSGLVSTYRGIMNGPSRLPALPAPEFDVTEWIGNPSPLSSLRGTVVLVETFQMLCAGCVNYGLPQAQRVARMFPTVSVIGLHTVFEHHEVTGPDALRVFLHEFGIRFPVGVDRHDVPGGMPVTMRTYGLEGTPSTLLIDKNGSLVFSHLGKVDDLALGVMIGQLIAAPEPVEGAGSGPGA